MLAKLKTGVAVVKEIQAVVNSGDCSNDSLMEQIRKILAENKHLTGAGK